jgi:hypothetical protein
LSWCSRPHPLLERPCAAPGFVRQGRGRPHRTGGKGALWPSYRTRPRSVLSPTESSVTQEWVGASPRR